MNRVRIPSMTMLILLAACGEPRQQTTTTTRTSTVRAAPVATPSPVDVSALPAAPDVANPAPLPPDDADPTAIEAARTVVERYYALIERGDYPAAYALWSDGGRASGKTGAGFAAGFARTASTRVAAGAPVNEDAGMGQSYVSVPVVVSATLKDGTRQRFEGSYVLSRVNDVDGSTAAQRRWHLRQARLHAVAAG